MKTLREEAFGKATVRLAVPGRTVPQPVLGRLYAGPLSHSPRDRKSVV
jgi:hypothetical protein